MNNLFDKKTYVALFAGLFILEAILSVWTGMQYDMDVWFNTGRWLQQGINIYVPANHIGYPPLWSFWCDAAYRVYLFFSNNIVAWRFTIKLPLIVAHLALAFVVGEYAARRFDPKTARRIFLFVLTWSFFIFIGAMWGQINTVSALLTFLAFYALTRGNTKMSAFLLGVAVTLKIYPLVTLPAFLIYALKSKSGKEAAKFALITIAVPVIFTVAVFSVFQWDITYLFRTIFYWTPAYDATPVQIQGGAMNIWSFTYLLSLDMAKVWILRFVWIPVLAIASFYWFKKPKMDEARFCLSIISFYLLFMVTYAWVPEQTFVDVLPFIFIQILAFRPRRTYLYLLAIIQILIYAFSAVNWGVFIFTPFLKQYYPDILAAINPFSPANSYVWTARGILGLFVSLALGIFLALLAKPSVAEAINRKIHPTSQTKENPTKVVT